MSAVKALSLLGSTGSIGQNVCAVVRQFPERYRLVALAAGHNVQVLARQIQAFQPEAVSVADETAARELAMLLSATSITKRPEILVGEDGLCQIAAFPAAQMTVNSVVGAAGLKPTMAALGAGKMLGLANKETLVMAGQLVMQKAAEQGIDILPIDSEHSAIFQSLHAGKREDLRCLILTASGGPFRGYSKAQLQFVGPEAALAHPNWSMGRKITIDSATLMNKGLEVIEARWLFDVPPDEIKVLVHPQSIVHSLVEFQDGAVIAQLGIPDMRLPIALALSYPERLPLDMPRLDLAKAGTLEFLPPDNECFPALNLAREALKAGGVCPAVLNAANEIAVPAFLSGQIPFLAITSLVAECLSRWQNTATIDLDGILAADFWARREALSLLPRFAL